MNHLAPARAPVSPEGAEEAHARALRGGPVGVVAGNGETAKPAAVPLDPVLEDIQNRRAKLHNTDGTGKLFPKVPVSMRELDAQDFPEPQWLIRNVLEEKTVMAISGEPKAAKSFSGLEMMLSVASGTRAFGRFDVGPPRPAVAFCAEDAPVHVRRRVRALAAGKNLDQHEKDTAWSNLFIFERQNVNLMDVEILDHFMAHLQRLPAPPAAVMLDPLVDLFDVEDENAAREMSAAMQRLRVIRDVIGCAVIIVHHASRSGPGKSKLRGGQKMRGSTAIHGAVDGGFYMTNTESSDATKSSDVELETRNGRTVPEFRLSLNFEDDAAGRVTRAWWDHGAVEGGPAPRAPGPADDAVEKRILQLLKMQSLTPSDLVREVGQRRALVYAVIKKLQDERRITRGLRGMMRLVEPAAPDTAGPRS